MTRGAAATKVSLARSRVICIIALIVGITCQSCALLWVRLATDSEEQTHAMSMYFFTTTISGNDILLSSLCFFLLPSILAHLFGT
jgi:hypothetical protein